MKKEILLLAACLLLCGCTATPFHDDNPYRVDTVVQIPVDPTEEPTETPTEITEETEMPTETVPEETTASKTTTSKSSGKSSSGSKSSTSKSSSSKGSSGKTSTTKATEPASTEVPTKTPTGPAATEVPTKVPAEPASTEVPTEVPTEPAVTQPAETEPLETEAPATEAPVTEAPTDPPYDPGSYSVGGLEYAILEQMNSHRSDAGLGAFSLNAKLCGIAALRAEEICESWSHTRPDGRSYTSAMSDYGYGFGTAAESLLYVSGGADAAAVVEKWMGSDEHAGYILSSGFATVGVGIYCANGFTYIAVLYVG